MEETYLSFFNNNKDKYIETDKNGAHSYVSDY